MICSTNLVRESGLDLNVESQTQTLVISQAGKQASRQAGKHATRRLAGTPARATYGVLALRSWLFSMGCKTHVSASGRSSYTNPG